MSSSFLSWSAQIRSNEFCADRSGVGCTKKKLVAALASADESFKSRAATEQKKMTQRRECKESASRVTALLRRKVGETRAIKERLESAHDSLETEFGVLTNALATNLQLLQAQHEPLKTAKHRLAERATLPSNNEPADKVQAALAKEIGEVTTSINKLVLVSLDVEALAQQMRNVKLRLTQDISNKEHSIDIDVSCLNLPAPGSDAATSPAAADSERASVSGVEPDGGDPKRLTWALQPAAAAATARCEEQSLCSYRSSQREFRHVAKLSHEHPREWKVTSERVVGAAASYAEESQRLRKRMRLLHRHIVRNNERFAAQTRAAFDDNLRRIAGVRTAIAARQDRLEDALAGLRGEKEVIHTEILGKDAPLQNCIRRLALRRSRRSKEATHDPAEASLANQMGSLRLQVRELEGILSENVRREKKLNGIRKELDNEMKEREREKTVDEQLLAAQPCYVTNLAQVPPHALPVHFEQLLTHFRTIQQSGTNKLMQMYCAPHQSAYVSRSDYAGSATDLAARSLSPQAGHSPFVATHGARDSAKTPQPLTSKALPLNSGASARIARSSMRLRPQTALR